MYEELANCESLLQAWGVGRGGPAIALVPDEDANGVFWCLVEIDACKPFDIESGLIYKSRSLREVLERAVELSRG